MSKNANQSKEPRRIYIRSQCRWQEVPEEVYQEHIRFHDTYRHRMQDRGLCCCPRNKWWVCDADCLTCEYRNADVIASLDSPIGEEDDDLILMDTIAYVKPKVGINKFGGECITYEGVGSTKKWERLDSYGPKFVENIVQATARDILCYAMQTLRCCSIVMHIHDEVVIEAEPRMSLEAVCEQMGRTPPWATGLLLRADGYTTPFYKKD